MRAESSAARFSDQRLEIVRELSRLGQAYFEIYLTTRSAEFFPNRAEDWRDGLGFFLDRAFEHQGTSADFSEIARLTVKETLRGDLDFANRGEVRKAAKSVWQRFCEIGGFDRETGKGANGRLNPLFLNGVPFRENALEVCATLKDFGGNLYKMALAELRAARVDEAHSKLKSIRGVADKIASLFLRDVAIENEPDLAAGVVSHRRLQPVDRWVERAVGILEPQGITGRSTAEACVEIARAAETSPLLVNAGAWYLGAQIANGTFLFRQALSGTSRFQEVVVSHAIDLRTEGQLLRFLFEGDLRKRFLDDLRKVWRRNDLSEDSAMELARSEVAAHRSGH
jgi:hypothetical protein